MFLQSNLTMRILYRAFIRLYLLAVVVMSVFSRKARAWHHGRHGLIRSMEQAGKDNRPVAWFHCASLGEFEQGRPIMEAFRTQHPGHAILLTFFSPSGYEIRKGYEGADHVFYLPADTMTNARKFLDIWNPDIAVFIKYEYWFNYLSQLKNRGIPVVVASAVFRRGQHFFQPYGWWFRKHLGYVSHFYVQNEQAEKLLRGIGLQQVSISGDTRFDRVVTIAEKSPDIPDIKAFTKKKPALVAGSTWEADEKILAAAKRDFPQLNMIIAPHQITEKGIQRLLRVFDGHVVRYSEATGDLPDGKDVLVIDGIGLLSSLYRYGRIAYIGGGFGIGIHNILEAATFGLPIIFGPRYQKFNEANDLIRLGGAFPVSSAHELIDRINELMQNQTSLLHASGISKEYVINNTGATTIITNGITRLITK